MGFPGTPNKGTPYPYYSHTTPIRIPKDMGMVWEAYHKGVPLLGFPENPTDSGRVSKRRWTKLGYFSAHFSIKQNVHCTRSKTTRPATLPYCYWQSNLPTQLGWLTQHRVLWDMNTLELPPHPGFQSPPGWDSIFRLGNPELHLHLWRLHPGGGGGRLNEYHINSLAKFCSINKPKTSSIWNFNGFFRFL